jgi:predicted DCC family thiol-disulfide oxidoreductase YuxK
VTTTLLYDGDCAFCASSVRWVARLGLRVDTVIAWQHADLAALGLTEQQCEQALQLVEGGRVSSGHTAVGRLLLRGGWWRRTVGLLLLLPPTSWFARSAYRWVAAQRHRLPGGTPSCSAHDRP